MRVGKNTSTSVFHLRHVEVETGTGRGGMTDTRLFSFSA